MPTLPPIPSGRAHDVLCVGTALIDHLSFVPFETLSELGLPVGAVTLADTTMAARIASALGAGETLSGGTVANTAVGISSLGGAPVFIGAVAADDLGDRYDEDLRAAGVTPQLERLASPAGPSDGTGVCYVMVTPDAERTMVTKLGVSGLLQVPGLGKSTVAQSSLIYFDGYLLDFPNAEPIIEELIAQARHGEVAIALGLADRLVVERHHDALLALLPVVDVVFANQAEAIGLCQVEDVTDAIRLLSSEVPLVVVTRGPAGALLASEDSIIEIPASPVDEVVDLTGAGDLFAAGVIYGLTHGLDLARCGALGALCAAEVISHLGARPQVSLRDLAAKTGVLA